MKSPELDALVGEHFAQEATVAARLAPDFSESWAAAQNVSERSTLAWPRSFAATAAAAVLVFALISVAVVKVDHKPADRNSAVAQHLSKALFSMQDQVTSTTRVHVPSDRFLRQPQNLAGWRLPNLGPLELKEIL